MHHNNKKFHKSNIVKAMSLAIVLTTMACSKAPESMPKSTTEPAADSAAEENAQNHPSAVFDLNHWKITLPMDANNDGKVDEIKVQDMQNFTHPDYFYLDADNNMVFTAPNVAMTTANSKNARSELRYMSRGTNTQIKTHAPQNNFSVSSHPNAAEFSDIGRKMQATLKVDHVGLKGDPVKYPSYSVVIGQIHAGKDKNPENGFGYGNEPLKIYFKKFPDHDIGSVFWNYERNLAKNDPDRTDIAYPVWGNTWENSENPGDAGIALGQEFSYVVNVVGDVMHLTFSAKGKDTVNYSINLANNVDAYGNVDEKDFENGYAGDWHYFKAGAYNQCNGGTENPFWGTGCSGTGDWATDYKNGDYTQVSFSQLVVTEAQAVDL